MNDIEKDLISKISDLHGVPQGAYNIRLNGKLHSRNNTANIEIESKPNGSGINIYVKDNTQNESLHIPVIVSANDLHDVVSNDFFIGENCDVLIVAGCGVHNVDSTNNGHDGIHTFHVGKNSKVVYIEKHLGTGNKKSKRILNPTTVVNLSQNASLSMQTIQLGGVSSAKRTTKATLEQNAILEIKESILTTDNEIATTQFEVDLNGKNSKVNLVSRSVARDKSYQQFVSKINGNTTCFGHVECDAIVMDKANVSSTPALNSVDSNATLSHEAMIGKIANEQVVKLQTLGLSEEQAVEKIIKGFLK